MFEECDYYGEDEDGVSAPPGQITIPTECEEYCRLFQNFGQCSYWVFNSRDVTCTLLNSSDRWCDGVTGPKSPSFDDCDLCSYMTTTPAPATSTTPAPGTTAGPGTTAD